MSRRERGVTLIEVLIAVTLVSLLAVGMLMAIRVGLNAMGKTNARVMANRRVIGAQRALERMIAGFMPVTADCVGDAGVARAKVSFFQGEPESIRFVSSYSLAEGSRGFPRVLEFQVIPGARGEGVRLVVNEHLYTGPTGAGWFCLGPRLDPARGVTVLRFRPIEVGPRSFVLADRLAACRFWFRQSLPPPRLEQWTQHWVLPTWPTAVRVEMVPLATDASRMQLLSMTAPVYVNRTPLTSYAD